MFNRLESSRDVSPNYTTREAALKAEDAKKNAEEAIHLYSKVRRWDRSSTAFSEAVAAMEPKEAPQPVIAYKEKIITKPSQYEKLKGSKVISNSGIF